MMTESDVIARAIQKDEAAQRALYETHFAAAFRLAYLLLQDAGEAEETVHDAFVYLFRNLQRYDPARGSFWAWLRVTLVSRCRNRRRGLRPDVVPLDRVETADPRAGNDPARVLELHGVQQPVWTALQQLSPGTRAAMILRYYEELPYAEIAPLLGCSEEAARARVAHGKVQLRRLLGGTEAAPLPAHPAGRVVKA